MATSVDSNQVLLRFPSSEHIADYINKSELIKNFVRKNKYEDASSLDCRIVRAVADSFANLAITKQDLLKINPNTKRVEQRNLSSLVINRLSDLRSKWPIPNFSRQSTNLVIYWSTLTDVLVNCAKGVSSSSSITSTTAQKSATGNDRDIFNDGSNGNPVVSTKTVTFVYTEQLDPGVTETRNLIYALEASDS